MDIALLTPEQRRKAQRRAQEQRRLKRRRAENPNPNFGVELWCTPGARANPDYPKVLYQRRKTARKGAPAKRYPAVEKARDARRYAENPEYFKAKAVQWTRENPAGARANAGRRRARERDQTCTCCSPADFRAVYAQAAASGLEVDHRIPLCIGGWHCVKNLQALTPEMHARKTRADIAEFRMF